jgi:hypothetical protein
MRAASSAVTCSPSRIATGSPGIACMNRKLTTVIANSTSTSRTKRSTRKRAIASQARSAESENFIACA